MVAEYFHFLIVQDSRPWVSLGAQKPATLLADKQVQDRQVWMQASVPRKPWSDNEVVNAVIGDGLPSTGEVAVRLTQVPLMRFILGTLVHLHNFSPGVREDIVW